MAKALKVVGTVVAVVTIAATAIATYGASLSLTAGLIGAAQTVAVVGGIQAAPIGPAAILLAKGHVP